MAAPALLHCLSRTRRSDGRSYLDLTGNTRQPDFVKQRIRPAASRRAA